MKLSREKKDAIRVLLHRLALDVADPQVTDTYYQIVADIYDSVLNWVQYEETCQPKPRFEALGDLEQLVKDSDVTFNELTEIANRLCGPAPKEGK